MTVEKILLGYEPEKENILPALKKIQKEFGCVSAAAIRACADYFRKKPAAIYSAASFYDHIDTETPTDVKIFVCDGSNCSGRKSEEVIREIERLTGRKVGDDFDPKIKIRRESCFGLCTNGPIVKVNDVIFEKVTPATIDDILAPYIGK